MLHLWALNNKTAQSDDDDDNNNNYNINDKW